MHSLPALVHIHAALRCILVSLFVFRDRDGKHKLIPKTEAKQVSTASTATILAEEASLLPTANVPSLILWRVVKNISQTCVCGRLGY